MHFIQNRSFHRPQVLTDMALIVPVLYTHTTREGCSVSRAIVFAAFRTRARLLVSNYGHGWSAAHSLGPRSSERSCAMQCVARTSFVAARARAVSSTTYGGRREHRAGLACVHVCMCV